MILNSKFMFYVAAGYIPNMHFFGANYTLHNPRNDIWQFLILVLFGHGAHVVKVDDTFTSFCSRSYEKETMIYMYIYMYVYTYVCM